MLTAWHVAFQVMFIALDFSSTTYTLSLQRSVSQADCITKQWKSMLFYYQVKPCIYDKICQALPEAAYVCALAAAGQFVGIVSDAQAGKETLYVYRFTGSATCVHCSFYSTLYWS